jgi:predicted phosphodiesterase
LVALAPAGSNSRFDVVRRYNDRHRRPCIVSGELIRIISDLHYGDRASSVHRLAQLRPLLHGVTELIVNGDLLDTRPGPDPQFTARLRAEVQAFASGSEPVVTLITGNHDPDLSAHHALECAGGEVWVTHGDIAFDQIVPWGRDATLIGRGIKAGLDALPPAAREQLDERFTVWRRVAATVPQRHQSETNGLSYALRFAADTIWPPMRGFRILRAWHEHSARMVALARQNRRGARFIVVGHIHRPAVWHAPTGEVVINTGSFCRPFGGYAVDLAPGRLCVRRVLAQQGEFRAGPLVAEFALAEA